MGKPAIGDRLKQRIAATQQATERQVGDLAYSEIFHQPVPTVIPQLCHLPISKLRPFFTADIGFKPYPQSRLEAFANQLDEEGQLERIIVRKMPGADTYEILAGHNRTEAARLAGWTNIAAEVLEVDDDRAITIAISTNLLRRQGLTILERGQAYKTLLAAKNKNGQRNAWDDSPTFGENRQRSSSEGDAQTFGENRQRYNAREIVAEFFNVSEYEIRKAIKLTQLIPPLAKILEDDPKHLNLACADLIADYDPQSQEAFIEICSIEGYFINKSTVQFIRRACPPPSADCQAIYAAWRGASVKEERKRMSAPPKITFDRKQFAPYLKNFQSDEELATLFLEFLKSRSG